MRKQVKIYGYLGLCVASLIFYSFLTLVNPIEISSQKPSINTLIDDGYITGHMWSSDGSKIAYVKCPNRQLWGDELWVAEWNGKEIRNRQLIYTGVEYFGLQDWQGDWILFVLRHEQTPSEYYGTRELWKIRDDGTDLTQITFTNTNGIRTTWANPVYTNMGTVSGGRFIPGTDLVAFSAHNGNGWYRLFVCNADGTDNWYRVSGPYEFSFTWAMSPTGNKLVWGHAGYWNAPTTLYSADIDGSNKVLVKSSSYYRLGPLILADGNTLIFRYVGSGWYPNVPTTLEGNIYAIDLDGTNERTILDDDYLNYHENYNPVDGQALLMRSDRSEDGNMHIYTLNIDGTGIVQLTEGPYNDDSAVYSPNGHYIMYRRLPEDFDKGATTFPYPYDLVITRIDVSNPTSSHPDDQTVAHMEPDVNIVWNLYDDAAPGAFVVLRNGKMVTYPLVWTNDTAITIPVDTSEVGDWNYTIVFTDALGKPGIPDTVWITVLDVTNPWSSHPDDLIVHLVPPGHPVCLIVWHLYDDIAPGTFTVLCNENLVIDQSAWINNTAIVIPVFASELGKLNYKIVFTDAAGNIASDTCIITVQEIFPWPPLP
ncbi:MAG: hypothetical protein ACFE95_07600 [Candidatus Hodarchaeota archaeon]